MRFPACRNGDPRNQEKGPVKKEGQTDCSSHKMGNSYPWPLGGPEFHQPPTSILSWKPQPLRHEVVISYGAGDLEPRALVMNLQRLDEPRLNLGARRVPAVATAACFCLLQRVFFVWADPPLVLGFLAELFFLSRCWVRRGSER